MKAIRYRFPPRWLAMLMLLSSFSFPSTFRSYSPLVPVVEGFTHAPVVSTATRIHQPQLLLNRLNAASAHDLPSTTTESLIAEHAQDQLEDWYDTALSWKCPFLRRRATDVLDVVDNGMRGLRNTNQDPILSLENQDAINSNNNNDTPLAFRYHDVKQKGISLQQLAQVLEHDWRTDTNRGYYITGKVTTSIYRNDCLFDGPDPDMPIQGLPKYLNVASQLFCPARSRCQLLSLTTLDNGLIQATWKMKARMRLPWKPWLPQVTGKTLYYTDEDGLIYKHVEEWDISVRRAFVETFWPALARRLYKNNNNKEEESNNNNKR